MTRNPSPPHRVPRSPCSGWQPSPCPHRRRGSGLWSACGQEDEGTVGGVPCPERLLRLPTAVLGRGHMFLSENRQLPVFSRAPRPQRNLSVSLLLHYILKGPIHRGKSDHREAAAKLPAGYLCAAHSICSLPTQLRGQAQLQRRDMGAGAWPPTQPLIRPPAPGTRAPGPRGHCPELTGH